MHEIKAKLGLGRCLEAIENINEAIVIFEENLKEAEDNEYETIVEHTAKELVSIYS